MNTPNLLVRMLAGSRWTFLKQISESLSSLNYLQSRALSNNTALISKIHRESYLKSYQALVVQPDGSTFSVRYHEPRAIIQLPLDLSTLSPEEVKLRLLRRQPRKKVVIVQEEKDTYQASKYIKLVKKKRQ